MPWKSSCLVNERMKFVTRLEAGERMTDLTRELGISRKTGYKIWKRYKKAGPTGLYDESRAPRSSPHRTTEAMVALILELKSKYPTWGAKKLRWRLRRDHRGLKVPSIDTIHRILARHNLVKTRRRRSRFTYNSGALQFSTLPNDIWAVDYKGHFRLGAGPYCYPLTITDHESRFLLACEALDNTKALPARHVFEQVFSEFGLPKVIRSDNGAPFASRGLLGLTKLSVFWLKLGIDLERIEPGHPEQNGRHERMHFKLKNETTRPAASNALAQQERFDLFRDVFNCERPHESIGMRPPAVVYRPSKRSYPTGGPADPEYPLHDITRRVHGGGLFRPPNTTKTYYLCHALSGELVGLRELKDDCWLVSFAHVDLGVINLRTQSFEPNDVLPTKPVPPSRPNW